MRRFKFFVNQSKEETWLSKMAEEGYILEDASFGYKFRIGEPQNMVIRVDYRTFKSEEDYIEYRTLFEDAGWSYICGSKNLGFQYFKKSNNSTDDDIFSDHISRAEKYKRLSYMWLTLSIGLVPTFMVLVNNKLIDVKALFNPKLLYETSGLWEMSGEKFWKSFLFETPFVIMRCIVWMAIPIVIVFYIYCIVKSQSLYHKEKNSNL